MRRLPVPFDVNDLDATAVAAGESVGIVSINAVRGRLTLILGGLIIRCRGRDIVGRFRHWLKVRNFYHVEGIKVVYDLFRFGWTGNFDTVIAVQISQLPLCL